MVFGQRTALFALHGMCQNWIITTKNPQYCSSEGQKSFKFVYQNFDCLFVFIVHSTSKVIFGRMKIHITSLFIERHYLCSAPTHCN